MPLQSPQKKEHVGYRRAAGIVSMVLSLGGFIVALLLCVFFCAADVLLMALGLTVLVPVTFAWGVFTLLAFLNFDSVFGKISMVMDALAAVCLLIAYLQLF